MAAAFPTWKTITLGGHKDSAAYHVALQAGDYRIGNYTSQLLAKTPIAATETQVDLVCLTVREMGFLRGATTAEIYTWAEAHGLKKCPAEVGPALRLAYADQPSGEHIRVGMEPIADSDGDLRVFIVGNNGLVRWLDADWTGPVYRAKLWYPEYVWVFLRSS